MTAAVYFKVSTPAREQRQWKTGFPELNRKCEHQHWILHIWMNLGTKFQLNLTILICYTKFASKWCFREKTEKSEHHQWILHIRISLGTKFKIKPTVRIFWAKFARGGCFRFWAGGVGAVIGFCIFGLVCGRSWDVWGWCWHWAVILSCLDTFLIFTNFLIIP